MLCCVGLIGGLAVGQSLGGPWTYIAPAAGFGIGLLADMKFMHKMHAGPANPQRNDSPSAAGGHASSAAAEAPPVPKQRSVPSGG